MFEKWSLFGPERKTSDRRQLAGGNETLA